ncbi:Hypothetical protein A7982_11172 [Minicystis rosea]|nr:Hypothetical protein A7982_11172 [Minicystis rosea]
MKTAKAWLFGVALAAVALANVRDADACGGCFVAQSESTVVTGHKMILSISQQQTTLYDQIVYSGDPSSFAWILPVKGVADVGLSSDALFQALDQQTTVTINSPQITCPPPPDCGGDDAFFGGGGAGGASGEDPVTVVAQSTVGPYETVQLKSSSPGALAAWLAEHGYNIPADVQPVVDAYVGEGFDFLALKLVPGKGINAMRPVRITTAGASPVLPLRMVAAGTGPITPITLWVMGEGRYDTVNLPSFQVDGNLLVWNWDTSQSNYTQLKQVGFASTQNKGWLIQAAEPFSKYWLSDSLYSLAEWDPEGSGYADENGMNAAAAVDDDMAALFGSIAESSLWVTRLNGELARSALGADLQLGASASQATIQRTFNLTFSTGTPPACPSFPPCDPGEGSNDGWGLWGNNGNGPGGGNSTGCAMTHSNGMPMLGGLALMAALAFARRRRHGR